MLCTSPSSSKVVTPIYPLPAHPTKIQAFTERGGDPTFVNSVVIVE